MVCAAVQVVNWLLDMLQLTHGEAAPATSEARRVLCFFAASLHNPKMPTAATVACTRSMTTLTPHYGEDVMYALNKAVAEAEMEVQGLKGGDDNTFLVNVRGDNTEVCRHCWGFALGQLPSSLSATCIISLCDLYHNNKADQL